MERPTLETNRLILRPFRPEDAPAVQRFAGHREVASTTEMIPHPYPEGAAEAWIATHQQSFEEGRDVAFAITLRDTGDLAGAIGLMFTPHHDRGEIGYWIAVPYWGKGVATEAARAVVDYGFRERGLQRIEAVHFTRNPASGRVMQKLGMKYEGRRRNWMKKWDQYEDVEMYGVLRDEWMKG